MTSTCPDCDGTLAPGAMRCRCGWVQQRMGQVVTPHVVPCDECGKPTRRVGARLICGDCEAAERQAGSKKFCEEHGLVTREDMVAFCKKRSRSFGGGPSFETWTKNMTQGTVDIIERMDGQQSKALDRLRVAGVIDGRNKLIPLEARKTAAEAHAAERARLVVQAQAELAAREPEALIHEEAAK